MILSNSNLELLRSRPTKTKLDLFIFQPKTVMKCRINNSSIAKGDRTIPYNTVTTGSFSSVEDGMTMLIGTSDGASDIGRIRVRSASSSSFVVSENSNIAWANSLYITILRYWEIWPVFPRIIQNPSNLTDVIFYKDYDIPYSNQNSILGTFVNAGPHRPVFLQNGTGTTFYSSTGTYNLLGDALTYDWAFEGGTPTGSTSANPGNVNYTVPGDYVTRLKVTSASGAIDTIYKYVSVKNKIGEGSITPVKRWKMEELSGSRSEAGYSADFTIYDDIQIDNNAVVMLLADDWYGGTNVSLGGNYPNTENIFFVGYIDSGSIRYNYQYNYYTFTASSISKLMKRATGFSVSVGSKFVPTKWFELLDMDCRRAIYHYLYWHSTVLKTIDFNFIGQDYKIQYFDADRTSLFDAIDNLMRTTLVGNISSDRQGRLWAEVEPMAYSNPTGSFPPVMEITKRDWMSEPEIEEKFEDNLSALEYGGVAYSGVITGTFSAFLSNAPGSAPAFRGTIETNEGLALQSQTQLNLLTGNVFFNRNSRYPRVNIGEMSTSPRNLDIAPQETTSVKINPSDTIRGIALDKLYIPDTFSWRYNPEKQTLISSIEMKNLINGVPGDTITIPATPSDNSSGLGFGNGFKVPGLKIPPLPILTIPPYLGAAMDGAINQALSYAVHHFTKSFVAGDGTVTFNVDNSTIPGLPLYNNITGSFYTDNGSSIFILNPGTYLILLYANHGIFSGEVEGDTSTISLATAGAVSAAAGDASSVRSVVVSKNLSALVDTVHVRNWKIIKTGGVATFSIRGTTTAINAISGDAYTIVLRLSS